jgi:S1-C subfamily serine protease
MSSELQQSSQQFQQQKGEESAWLGISGVPLPSNIAKSLALREEVRGVLVIRLAAAGPADKAGLLGGYKADNVDGREILLGGHNSHS